MYKWPTDKYTKPESIVSWAANGGCSDVISLTKHMCRDEASRAVFAESVSMIKMVFANSDSTEMDIAYANEEVTLSVSINLDSSWSQGSGLVGSSEKNKLEAKLKTSDTAGLLIDTKAKEYTEDFDKAKAELEEIIGHDIDLTIDWEVLKSWNPEEYTKPESIVTWTANGCMSDLKALAKHACRDVPSQTVFASVVQQFVVSFAADDVTEVEIAVEGSVVNYIVSINLSSSWSQGSGQVGSTEKNSLESQIKTPATLPLLIATKAAEDIEDLNAKKATINEERKDLDIQVDFSGLESWPTDKYTKPELIVEWAYNGAMSDVKSIVQHLCKDGTKDDFAAITTFVLAFGSPTETTAQASKNDNSLVYTASINLDSSWSKGNGIVGSSERDAFALALKAKAGASISASSSSSSSSEDSGRGRAFSVINVDHSAATDEETMKAQIIEAFIPAAQQRIAHSCGVEIPFEVEWASFDNTNNKERAIQSLWSWNGYFMFIRTAMVIEDICENSYGKDDVATRMKKIVISHESKVEDDDKIKFDATSGVVALTGDFNYGSAGCFSKRALRLVIRKVLGLTSKYYVRKINDESIPRFNEKMNDIIGKEIEVSIDWESFEKAEDMEDAFYYMASWRGYYTFDRVASGVRRAVERDDQLTYKELLQKVVFRHIPGKDYRKRRVSLTDGTLYIVGCFETYWGCPGYWDVYEVLHHTYKFASMGEFIDMDEDAHEKKLDLWKDACTSSQVVNGDVEYIKRLMENKCFWQPDEHEVNAVEKFMEDYAEDETLIGSWFINKINFRGQEQDRMLVLTDKQLWTFAYDFAKSKVDSKRVHEYDHEDYRIIRMGELAGSDISVPDAIPGSSAMGAAANAAADLLGSKRYGLFYLTDKSAKKGNLLGNLAGSLGLGKKIMELMQKMVDTLLADKEDSLPEINLPQLPIWNPEKVAKIALESMGSSDDELPMISLNGLPPANVIDCVSMLLEAFEALGKKQPRLKLDNMPIISIPYLLNGALEVLINSENEINLPMPEGEPNMMVMLKQLVEEVVSIEEIAPMPLPPIEDISLKEMLQVIRTTLVEKEVETIDQRLPSIGDLPAVVDQIDQICAAIDDDLMIKFPELPELPIDGVLKKLAEALSEVELPSFDMSGFDFGIDMPDMPNIDMPSIDMPKVDMPDLGIEMPSLPGGGLGKKLKKLKTPKKPEKLEMMAQPIILDENGNELEGMDNVVAQEISWALYGVARAANKPWYLWRPYTTSISLPESTVASVYNKMGKGLANKPGRG
eukprot:TRINITY_DN1518_c0_g1_i1.p1 TRINITY_DN1518_c0_g1~~TRINITY_DN1518_c0_g1_i1.p1  ORF type:complete len:1269 (+),score=566.40 TRINITY_DN1518_c0_g1_i1:1967-5773(+)